MDKKVVYISHVHARWIKQRPHFLSEGLANLGYDVTFAFSVITRKTKLVKGQKLQLKLIALALMPQRLRNRFEWLSKVMDGIASLWIIAICKPDIAIVSHPRFAFLARLLRHRGVKIIYDCMDLNSEFDDALNQDIADERALVDISFLTLCSSSKIADSIRAISPNSKMKIIRNALATGSYSTLPQIESIRNRIGYFGTISSWFDWEIVIGLVDCIEDIEIHLWGPVDSKPPTHERVFLHGQIEHSLVVQKMLACEILIMPFRVTPLIEGVDPVKLYEYIATGRTAVSIRYAELDHFGALLNTYSSLNDLIEIVSDSRHRSGISENERSLFVSQNTWIRRAEELERALIE